MVWCCARPVKKPARVQKGGLGRHPGPGDSGSAWFSPQPPRAEPLPFLPALALVRCLRENFGCETHLKWPNDVLVGHKKIAGILIESSQTAIGSQAWILGVGVNLRQQSFPGALAKTATSLSLATKIEVSDEDMLIAFLQAMNDLDDSVRDLVPLWTNESRLIGRELRVRKENQELDVTIIGLSPEGFLRIQRQDGSEEIWHSHSDLKLPMVY